MKKQALKISKTHPLSEMHEAMLRQQKLMADLVMGGRAVAKVIRDRLQAEHPEVDWALVHDLKFQDGEIELVTYEHPLEHLLGPMSAEERDRIEKLREQVQGAGLSKPVKYN